MFIERMSQNGYNYITKFMVVIKHTQVESMSQFTAVIHQAVSTSKSKECRKNASNRNLSVQGGGSCIIEWKKLSVLADCPLWAMSGQSGVFLTRMTRKNKVASKNVRPTRLSGQNGRRYKGSRPVSWQ